MRRLSLLTGVLLALACAAAPTALPQTSASFVATTGLGDSLFARVVFDSAHLQRQPAETIPVTVTDTLWCTPAGVCTAEPPKVPTDTIVPTPVARGVPFGTFGLFTSATAYQPGPFSLSHTWDDPGTVAARIDAARAAKIKLFMVMTAGHAPYLDTDTITGVTRFSLAKWKARMDQFNTETVRKAIAAGVADGTVIGASVMDEPNFRDWGGVMTKPLLDQMCGYVKGYFPTLPAGVVVVHWWKPTEVFRVCDFIVDQYDWWQSPLGPGGGKAGKIAEWRDTALAFAKRQGIAVAFSMNLLAGGIQDITAPIEWTCPVPPTGGKGIRSPTCRLSADQVRDWGRLLGSSGCALLMWRHDDVFMARPDNQQAFRDVAAALKAQPARQCRRS